MPSWHDDPLTEQEVEKLGDGAWKLALGSAVIALALLLVMAVSLIAISAAGADTSPTRKVGKAVYGYGQISYGGKGPEAWRWQKILATKDRDKMQRRLTARVLEVHSLQRQVALLAQLNLDPILAIRVVFGVWAAEAIRVSSCETGRTFDTGAKNGQYLGIFQMGSSERATYGHGSTALEQARAAYRYFVASGMDWSRWECQP